MTRSVPARGRGDSSTGVMLAFAFPDRVARNRGNGSFVLANGRGAAVDQTSALARAPYIAVAELTGTAAKGRILLAAPITHAEIEPHFADQIESDGRDFVRPRRDGVAGAAQAHLACDHAVGSADRAVALGGHRTGAGRWADRRRPRQIAVVETPQAMARPRDVLAQGRGEQPWPDLSDDALAAQRETWLVPALYDKTSLKEFSPAICRMR